MDIWGYMVPFEGIGPGVQGFGDITPMREDQRGKNLDDGSWGYIGCIETR